MSSDESFNWDKKDQIDRMRPSNGPAIRPSEQKKYYGTAPKENVYTQQRSADDKAYHPARRVDKWNTIPPSDGPPAAGASVPSNDPSGGPKPGSNYRGRKSKSINRNRDQLSYNAHQGRYD